MAYKEQEANYLIYQYRQSSDIEQLKQGIIALSPNHPNEEWFLEDLDTVLGEVVKGTKPLSNGSNSLLEWITDDDFDTD